ncbi:MAG: D-aminoacyl-tRNA deacylase [Succinatimonas sp.]|jgi:D-tyrosyl-tRNA(Tyr) deacylase|uniref:D-aminoacyl-tRNA deacylase n=1 Tax=Succinivibrio sp. TaxID=2053619 RepID=UPI002A26229E|nr:D-aminoacyl-tRNA deacylase [Succinatimonas sp.]MDD6755053.1 D-aminoacyl-tRNA deacylase [Succinatimonas sp.]MDY6245701.1 D-aminoacyl-tRNA deacylase [Succinivibrio sp.]MDY6260831.1 D-aminoacyl-tRNA deacylase [Succinivibrio sp.]
MLALLQRVNFAKVVVDGKVTGQIDKGILAFIGLEKGDNETKCKRMFDKIVKYRMFYDENEKLNLNVEQVSGSILLVSQFTLAANTASGNRPSFDPAMAPSEAKVLYEKFTSYAHSKFPRVEEGIFAADMKVTLENDGPVTFMIKY